MSRKKFEKRLYIGWAESLEQGEWTPDFSLTLLEFSHYIIGQHNWVKEGGLDIEDCVSDAICHFARLWKLKPKRIIKKKGDAMRRVYQYYYDIAVSAPLHVGCKEKRERDIKKDLADYQSTTD